MAGANISWTSRTVATLVAGAKQPLTRLFDGENDACNNRRNQRVGSTKFNRVGIECDDFAGLLAAEEQAAAGREHATPLHVVVERNFPLRFRRERIDGHVITFRHAGRARRHDRLHAHVALARLELELLFGALAEALPAITLLPGAVRRPGFQFRGYVNLPIAAPSPSR